MTMDYIKLHPMYRELQVDGHVRLVKPDIAHAEPSLLWVSSSEVVQYMGADFESPSLMGEKKRIEDILKNEDEYSWMIELDGKIVGNVCINSIAETTKKFRRKAGNLTVLIGKKSAWGKGLGAKVCTAVLKWVFEEGSFGVIAARALQENIASIKILEKLGFEEIGSEPYEGLLKGKPSVWRNFKIENLNNGSITVRAAKVKDAPRIAEIHVETWQHAYRGQVPDAFLNNLPSTLGDRTKKWQETLRKKQREMRVFVAEMGEQIVGFCIVNPCRDEDMDNKTVGELGAIYIDARYMNQGVGSALLKESLGFLKKAGFKKVTLWVLDTNEKARRWYESKGWTIEGKTKIDDRGDVRLHEVRYVITL
jgi:RimJ/RimL family protein N-acetyltransferase